MQHDDIPVFGERVIVPPHQSPNESTHQLWISTVPLCNSDCYLLGHFKFEPRSDNVRPNQFVAREIQDSLLLLCTSLCIVSPFLSLFSRK